MQERASKRDGIKRFYKRVRGPEKGQWICEKEDVRFSPRDVDFLRGGRKFFLCHPLGPQPRIELGTSAVLRPRHNQLDHRDMMRIRKNTVYNKSLNFIPVNNDQIQKSSPDTKKKFLEVNHASYMVGHAIRLQTIVASYCIGVIIINGMDIIPSTHIFQFKC